MRLRCLVTIVAALASVPGKGIAQSEVRSPPLEQKPKRDTVATTAAKSSSRHDAGRQLKDLASGDRGSAQEKTVALPSSARASSASRSRKAVDRDTAVTQRLRGSLTAGVDEELTAPAAHGSRGEDLGLRGSIDGAITSSPLVQAVDAETRAANAFVLKQQLSNLPTVSASLGQTRLYNDTGELGTARFSPDLRTERYGSVNLQWPVFNGFQNYFRTKSAVSSAFATGLEAQATRDDVALQTVNAYLTFVASDRSVSLINTNVRMLERLARAVRERKTTGFSSQADQLQVEADLAALRQQRLAALADREKAREYVSSLVGRPVTPKASFPQLERHLATGVEALVRQALLDNPRLLATRHNADAARYASRVAVGQYLPQVNVVGSYDRDLSSDAPPNLDPESWSLGVRLTVPLVQLSTLADVRQTKELAAAASFRADDAQRSVELQVRTLWKDYLASVGRLRLARQRASAQRRVANSWEEQFKLGLISLDSLLTRQRMLTEAEIEEQQATMQRYATICQLLVSAGIFAPAMLEF